MADASPEPIKSTLDQLMEVQAAISSILASGQSYTHEGVGLTRADLPALLKEQARLIRQYNRQENGDGIRVRRAVPIDN